MDLLLLRHGIAADAGPGQADCDRALTDEGRQRCRAAALGLASLGIPLTHVWSSPLRRARETAALVAPHQSAELRGELAGEPVEVLLAALRALPADAAVLAVGHEPQLSGVVAHLLGARAGAVVMKKAGLAHLRWSPPHWPHEPAWLLSLLTPAHLRVLGREVTSS